MVGRWHEISVPTETDERGSLSHIESDGDLPFDLERVFYIHDVPEDRRRGHHAHRNTHQVLICLKGQVEVSLEGKSGRKQVELNDPKQAIHLEPLVWTELGPFSEDCVLLVLASTAYDRDEYIEIRAEFEEALKSDGEGL